jgi:NAD(P)H-quinone oxidoreductase subunit 5
VTPNDLPGVAIVATVGLPGALFLVLSFAWLLGFSWRERTIVGLTALTYGVAMLLTASIWLLMWRRGIDSIQAQLGNWFVAGEYRFPLLLYIDHLSLPLVTMTVVLTGLVGAFSARYLHRESGFPYFFALLNLFGFGSLLLFAAGSFDLIVCGWELVGITSVLLIAFFHQRADPARNAMRVFAIYRVCDIGLLSGVVALHYSAGTASFLQFKGSWPTQSSDLPGQAAALVAFLFVLAACGKSAQVPFSGWLPRAMEGPTPSSAIFYGAISVHAGAYLLLRAAPLLAEARWIMALIVVVGILTAILATLTGRACTDAKTALAYASATQLGLIFAEIGLGFSTLVLWHICGHAAVRTLQFLRAPSALHEFHQIHAGAGGHLHPTGPHYEALLPAAVRSWLYRAALDRAHLDILLDTWVVAPILKLAHFLNGLERTQHQAKSACARHQAAEQTDV